MSIKVGVRAEKVFSLEKKDGWIVVNTSALDRDLDRVFSDGAFLGNYMKNPVVLWGHNYREPWAVIGRSIEVVQERDTLSFMPEFREATDVTDPMTIISYLWEAGFVRTASIGFIPLVVEENESGGWDISEWELLEWSIVPVPANQEALRRTIKALDKIKLAPIAESVTDDVVDQVIAVVLAQTEGTVDELDTDANSTDTDEAADKTDNTKPSQELVDALSDYIHSLQTYLEGVT